MYLLPESKQMYFKFLQETRTRQKAAQESAAHLVSHTSSALAFPCEIFI